MSKTGSILLAIVLTAAAATVAVLTGLVTFNVGVGGGSEAQRFVNKGALEVVCEVEVNRPGETLDQPFDTSKLTLPAVFNFEENTGAYPGEYAISMNRKGTLHIKGELLEIYRPSMFKRHGVVIIGERVTLNRQTGAFRQALELNGGKRLDLVRGTCKRTDNAPF